MEIPGWMFDAGTCCRMALSAVPSISVRSLRELTRLLSVSESSAALDVVKARPLSLPDARGACATTEPEFFQSTGAFSGSHSDSRMGEPSGGGSRTDLAVAGEASAGSLSGPRASRTDGGGP